MAFLEINGLRKRFGAVEILKGIDLTLDKGGFLVLVGPSGCGKSTLLNTIAGLESISSGEIRIDGNVDQRSAPFQARHRDGVPVLRALSQHVGRAEHGVRHGDARRSQGASATRRWRRSPRRCRSSICWRAGRASSPAASASASRWAARWCVSRACSCSTSRLSNLDAKLRVDMRIEIKRLHQRTGTTIVYVTHDQIEAMTLATRIAVLKDGELQQVGSPSEIYNSPANLFVADFMGSPSMNLLQGAVTRSDGAAKIVLERPDQPPIVLPAPASADVAASWPKARRSFSASGPRRSTTPRASTATRSRSRSSTPTSRSSSRRARTRSSSPRRRQGRDRAHARRRRRASRSQSHLRLQPRQGGAVRSGDEHAADFEGGTRVDASMTGSILKAVDILVVGSGMGGASCAAGLAPSGAEIFILERGERLLDSPEARDARAIFQRGVFRPQESWIDGAGKAVQSRQLLLRRRQHQALWRGADPLSRAGFPADRARRGRDAGLALRLRRIRALVHARRGAVITCAARSARTRPSRAIRRPILFPRCPTSRRSRRRARAWRASACTHSHCRSASTLTAGWRAPRRPGTPSPTPEPARWTRRPAPSRPRSPIPMLRSRPARASSAC